MKKIAGLLALAALTLMPFVGTILRPSDTTQEIKPSAIYHKHKYTIWERKIVEATAYSEECWESPIGQTASGTIVEKHRTLAGPPSMPFGTVVYIPNHSQRPNRGYYRVEDRGGAITEGRIDIYIPNKNEAEKFGRQDIEIFILLREEWM